MSYRAYIALAFLLSAAVTADGDTCIVSGDTSREAAASGASALGAGLWFDSSAFAYAVTPALRNFNSRPVSIVISFR